MVSPGGSRVWLPEQVFAGGPEQFSQVAVAVASVGALALAAEGLILAELSRGKRSANDVATFKIDPLFDAIAAVRLFCLV